MATIQPALMNAGSEAVIGSPVTPSSPSSGAGAEASAGAGLHMVRDLDAALLAAAASIGDRLCRTAIWHGSLCNWIGRSAEELDEATSAIEPTAVALDVDLYAGSAGVGLFLAALARATDEASVRRTAAAALRRALARQPSPSACGLHTGSIGIAYACVLGGRYLDHEDLHDGGLALARAALTAMRDRAPEEEGLDVIDGLAGSILGLLAMAGPDGGDLVDGAQALARRLVARGQRDDAGWRWDEAAGSGPPLTGLSHGAAGLGLALLEAHAVRPDEELLQAARGAFAWENTLFVDEQQNWPDRRPWVEAAAPGSCSTTWCHGAPGIALARLRACELDGGDARWRDDAQRALATTRRELALRRGQPGNDATLCHGTAGLAETLLFAAQVDGDPAARAEAVAVAHELAAEDTAGALVTGVPSGGPNPSLMLGTAGVGWFFLRARDPEGVPALLASPARRSA